MGALVATAEATTGVPAVDATVAWALAVAAVVALLAMVWRGMRALVRIAKRFDRMYEEYAGTPERDGVPAKPGMGVRGALLEGWVVWSGCWGGFWRGVRSLRRMVR